MSCKEDYMVQRSTRNASKLLAILSWLHNQDKRTEGKDQKYCIQVIIGYEKGNCSYSWVKLQDLENHWPQSRKPCDSKERAMIFCLKNYEINQSGFFFAKLWDFRIGDKKKWRAPQHLENYLAHLTFYNGLSFCMDHFPCLIASQAISVQCCGD